MPVVAFFGNFEKHLLKTNADRLAMATRQARQLVLSLVEALGPQHPRSASARRQRGDGRNRRLGSESLALNLLNKGIQTKLSKQHLEAVCLAHEDVWCMRAWAQGFLHSHQFNVRTHEQSRFGLLCLGGGVGAP